MKGYTSNIEKLSSENTAFRRVLYTAKSAQLVLMSLLPGEEIGNEIHDVDQFFRFEKGNGKVILNNADEYAIGDGSVFIVPAGTWHNIVNTSKSEPLKLYTLYCPPHHRDGVVHQTKAEGEADKTDEYSGVTTESRSERLWFRRKTYGWGWTPATWQGWAVTLAYLAIVVAAALTLDKTSSSREVSLAFFLPLVILTASFVVICYKKGEAPRWQWGRKNR